MASKFLIPLLCPLKVRWIRMIGYPDNPFAPYYFISNKYLDRIEQSTTQGGNPAMEDLRPLVGAISPLTPQDDAAGGLCVIPKQVVMKSNVSAGNLTEEELLDSAPYPFNFSPLKPGDTRNDLWSFSQVDVCSPNSSELAYGFGANYHQYTQGKYRRFPRDRSIRA